MIKYDSYKDSGINWIPMLPQHWEIKKIGSLFSERREKVSDKEYEPLSVSKNGITPQLETAVKTDNGDNRKLVIEGDFVVNSRSDRKGSCGISPLTGSVSLINIVLKSKGDIIPRYFHYLSRSNDYIEEYYRLGRGIVADLWTTRFSELKNLQIPYPPQVEQEKIARFIESKTLNIDTYVAERERELQLLNELKESEIANIVTRGLNPNVKLKDSGIPWIGMIPEHWGLRRIKYILTELKEKSELGTETPLSLSKEEGIIPFSEKKNRTMESASYVGGKLVHKGEIVFNRFKARLFAISNYDGIVSSDYAVYKCNDSACPEYLVTLFGTDMYREAFNRKASGIGDGFSRLYTDDLFAMYAIFPPLDEQREIFSYIRKRSVQINELISELQSEIELLKEYKQKLISDCVTGQIKVD